MKMEKNLIPQDAAGSQAATPTEAIKQNPQSKSKEI